MGCQLIYDMGQDHETLMMNGIVMKDMPIWMSVAHHLARGGRRLLPDADEEGEEPLDMEQTAEVPVEVAAEGVTSTGRRMAALDAETLGLSDYFEVAQPSTLLARNIEVGAGAGVLPSNLSKPG